MISGAESEHGDIRASKLLIYGVCTYKVVSVSLRWISRAKRSKRFGGKLGFLFVSIDYFNLCPNLHGNDSINNLTLWELPGRRFSLPHLL
jgi:hypothetical protein